jgi:hypothetical protein
MVDCGERDYLESFPWEVPRVDIELGISMVNSESRKKGLVDDCAPCGLVKSRETTMTAGDKLIQCLSGH